jgi:FlaA1/EpsC-like NDP-sugar epimerase
MDKDRRANARNIGSLVSRAALDIVMINAAMLIALYLRYDMHPAVGELRRLQLVWPVMTVLCVGSFSVAGLYRALWQYASLQEAFQIAIGTTMGMFATFVFGLIAHAISPTPGYFFFTSRTIYPIAWIVLLILVFAQRFSIRALLAIRQKGGAEKGGKRNRVLIVGAGFCGAAVLREFSAGGFRRGQVVVFVDDDSRKTGTRIGKYPVLRGIQNIPEYAQKYFIDEIIIAIPSATSAEMRAIMEACAQTPCALYTVPAMRDVTDGEMQMGKIRSVSIADLLFRDEVKLDSKAISGYLTGKTVLVTGGGGSIGSELCRQIARFAPEKLVIFDINENGAYELLNELKSKYGDALRVDIVIGSVRDKPRVEAVFKRYRPQVVFHAAAHKHVPLMETSPAEAIKNNVFGTLNVAQCADEYRARRFVLLSTDKVVNPRNVMGASKRITEMIMQYMGARSKTEFLAVRFGNVLGSNGSVVRLFMQQIEAGGPVRVTHPDITRYFMTIPEAAQLVLQAGAIAENGTIFVLDMGSPVKIVDLARNLIRLSGYKPDEEIKIVYTGLRPGDKMFEELTMSEERDGVLKTQNEKIFVIHPPEVDAETFPLKLEALRGAALADPDGIREEIIKLVPTCQWDDEGARADQSAG